MSPNFWDLCLARDRWKHHRLKIPNILKALWFVILEGGFIKIRMKLSRMFMCSHLWYFFRSEQLRALLAESRHCQSLLLETNVDYITALSPVMLAVEMLKLFRPEKLASPPKAPGILHGIPPEDWYGKEFYSASDKVSQGAVLWSPEFGISGLKKSESLDFYLAAKN